MQNTLQGLGSWLVKVAVLGSMTLWGISTLAHRLCPNRVTRRL